VALNVQEIAHCIILHFLAPQDRKPTLVHNVESAASPNLPPMDVLFGKTAAMHAVRNKIERVAETDVPVLIQGESGTGKELCVQLLHALSLRSRGSLVKVSCPAIPHSLLETELFGYEKGAFTGAMNTKLGRVEQAHQGTLFLDEVGSLDLNVQSKLLQVLQDGTFTRVGGHESRSIATRLVTAANGDLRTQVEAGTFRLDFLFRINAVTINLPPLRQRIADLPVLIDYFIEHYSKIFHHAPELLSKSAMRLMQNYHWPGNIRQLENLVRSYVLIGSEEALVAELMPEQPRGGITTEIDLSEPISLKNITRQATHDLERQIILKVLQANSWNRQKTAKWLQISYRSLLYKLSEAGMPEVPPRPLRVSSIRKTDDRTVRTALSTPAPRTRLY
jgi:two-component system response regulator AtoC